jgi:hypothetical protein
MDKKTAPAKEGDATRAVCKENSFCVLSATFTGKLTILKKFYGRSNSPEIILQQAKMVYHC